MYRRLFLATSWVVMFQMAIFMPLAPVLAQEEQTIEQNIATSSQETSADVSSLLLTAPEISPTVVVENNEEKTEPQLFQEEQEMITTSSVENNTNAEPDKNDIIAQPEQDENLDVEKNKEQKPTFSYADLMRRVNQSVEKKQPKDEVLIKDVSGFIESEKNKLEQLGVNQDKKDAYLSLLNKRLLAVGGDYKPSLKEKASDLVEKILGNEEQTEQITPSIPDIKIPEQPAAFSFNNSQVNLQSLPSVLETKSAETKLLDELGNIFSVLPVNAERVDLPVAQDVFSDGEAVITPEISDLAASLSHNPVKIFNYVRSEISYEPYFGAKKGSAGCLKEKFCNDVDSSSLLVSLLRASGIPARYKKSIIVMPVEQVKSLLGVEQTKTAYAAWFLSGVPVYVLSGRDISGGFESFDFGPETHLAVEWVFVEAFYDYDERGANVENILDLRNVSDTQELRDLLAPYTKKQWIALDAIVKPYTRSVKEIVSDTANFNTQNFWNNYLQYQGTNSPIEKYAADLAQATGKNINDSNYQTTKSFTVQNLDILPPTLPYYTRTGEVGGSLIVPEAWSSVPDARRFKVKISILKDSDKSVLLEQTFNGSEINNVEVDVYYEGATETDNQVIESYGGIYATPAALVEIKPYFLVGSAKYTSNVAVNIGDSLITQFEFSKSNLTGIEIDQKFSIAGNHEGLYVSLSKVQEDPELNTNSKILLRGNTALARAYLLRLQSTGDLLKKSLDYYYGLNFSRAVITQNRILNEVDGQPTTFDFNGLTIDAATNINDWSNRGIHSNHRSDFRLMWGLDSSYYEGQLFQDVAGLEGISTVKGLQYAYAHSGDYTVHVINSGNEAEIDSLDLSANTKANMHTDVQAGNTIYTPNKIVQDGAWRGVLYISLAADKTGTYAIGEQVSNGGWTINQAVLYQLQSDIDGSVLSSFQIDNGAFKYIFREKFGKSINCSIKIDTFARILANQTDAGLPIPAGEAQWKTRYGWPCVDDNVTGPYQFGNYQHKLIVATDGAKFYSPNRYEYWVSDDDMEFNFKKLFHYYNGYSQSQCHYPMTWRGGYCFIEGTDFNQNLIKTYWGTYVYEDLHRSYTGDPGTILALGVYNPEQRQVHKLSDRIYRKYISNEQIRNSYLSGVQYSYVPNLLGFPTGESELANTSPDGTSGWRQLFTNGAIYEVEDWFSNSSYIVYGPWYERYADWGGTGGIGFPESDVGYNSTYDGIVQKFKKKICQDFSGAISCVDRTFSNDFRNGLEGSFNALFSINALLTISQDKLFVSNYEEFLANIDSASETHADREHFCKLAYTTIIDSFLNYQNNSTFWFCTVIPPTIYQLKTYKNDIQNSLEKFRSEILFETDLLLNLQDSMQSQVSNATYGPAEWLGYFSVDIATLIFGLAEGAGKLATKQVALNVTKSYAEELISKRVDRVVLSSAIKQEVNKAMMKVGANATADEIEESVGVAVAKSVVKAGSNEFTSGKNLLRYKLTSINTSKLAVSGGYEISTALAGSRSRIGALDNGKKLVIYFLNRGTNGDQTFHMSSLVVDQFLDSGFTAQGLKEIVLDTIIEKNTLKDIAEKGKDYFLDTKMGNLSERIVDILGKEIDGAPIVGDIIFDSNVEGGKYFNVLIKLK